MSTIDYVYQFDPSNRSAKASPINAAAARQMLEEGNRRFSKWMEGCRTGTAIEGEPRFVVACNGLDVALQQMPKQTPFAVVVGCSDARVPTELLFGQGFNDLFVVRVAGNVLGDVCRGSVDYAINALSESVRVVVMLGHSGCGAVAATVDAYLQPQKLWSRAMSPMVRSIVQRIFVSVREAANGIEHVWGPAAATMPGYREALIETAVCVNAAHGAFDLRQQVERNAKGVIEVLYGVHNIRTHQVSMPVDPNAPRCDENVRLAQAPSDPAEFRDVTIRTAELLRMPQQQLAGS